MKFALLALIVSLMNFSTPLRANELAREDRTENAQKHAIDLPPALIVRTSKLDGSVAVHHSLRRLHPATPVSPKNFDYMPMKSTDRVKNELDRDGSRGGWYFYWYAYSYRQPAYYYRGYNYYYQPYYTVYYHPYTYTYYWWR